MAAVCTHDYRLPGRVRELRQKGTAGMVIALAGNKLDLAVKRAINKQVWMCVCAHDAP
jgi:hypothetical protein